MIYPLGKGHIVMDLGWSAYCKSVTKIESVVVEVVRGWVGCFYEYGVKIQFHVHPTRLSDCSDIRAFR